MRASTDNPIPQFANRAETISDESTAHSIVSSEAFLDAIYKLDSDAAAQAAIQENIQQYLKDQRVDLKKANAKAILRPNIGICVSVGSVTICIGRPN